MIPAGREAVNSAGAAEIMGLTRKQFQNRRVWELPGAPRALNGPDARRPLWDRGQWEAFAAGRELPVWRVGRDDPLDLLDQDEAAELLEVGTSTVRSYATEGRLTRVDVCGVTHFRRRELEHRKANPGEPGRPRTRGE